MKTAEVDSFFSAELVTEAGERAALDAPFAKLLTQADRAGQVAGASVNSSDAGAYWVQLVDKFGPSIAHAAAVGGPITKQAVSQAGAIDGANSAAFMQALASCERETVTQEQALAVDALRDECRASAGAFAMLDQFRALCGLVSVGVQSAQKAAKKTAIVEFKAAEMADRAKKARDKIIKRLNRALLAYGLKVDWQAVSATAVEAVEDEPETDASKAAKAITSAFKLDASAAIEALCKLEPALLTTLGAAIANVQAKAQLNSLAEHAEHTEDAAKALADKLGLPAATRENAPGAVVDLVSVANAAEQADIAADTLAKAQEASRKAKRRA